MVQVDLGKKALLDAAEELFDEQGVDAISLAEINRSSGHRNRSAVTYHFGDKYRLVQALHERTMPGLEARRLQLLDELEARDPHPTPRAVLDTAVTALVEQLDTLGGRRGIRLRSQLLGHPMYYPAVEETLDDHASLTRIAAHLAPLLAHLPAHLRRERVILMTTFLIRAVADHSRQVDMPTRDDPPLTTDEIRTTIGDLLEAMLYAPIDPSRFAAAKHAKVRRRS